MDKEIYKDSLIKISPELHEAIRTVSERMAKSMEPIQETLSELKELNIARNKELLKSMQAAILPFIEQQTEIQKTISKFQFDIRIQLDALQPRLNNLFDLVPNTSFDSLCEYTEQFEQEVNHYPVEDIRPSSDDKLTAHEFSFNDWVNKNPVYWAIVGYFFAHALDEHDAYNKVKWLIAELIKLMIFIFESNK